jgi:hypothetical protein
MLGLTIEEARESAAVREWMDQGRQEGETSVLLRSSLKNPPTPAKMEQPPTP